MTGSTDDLIRDVITNVRQAIETGTITDPDSALERVIDEIVNVRYQSMGTTQRQRFSEHLKAIIPEDPILGARLRDLLETGS